jgi:hypothetical protein
LAIKSSFVYLTVSSSVPPAGFSNIYSDDSDWFVDENNVYVKNTGNTFYDENYL